MGRIWLRSPMISELASRNDEARILGVFDTVNKKEAAIDHRQLGQQMQIVANASMLDVRSAMISKL